VLDLLDLEDLLDCVSDERMLAEDTSTVSSSVPPCFELIIVNEMYFCYMMTGHPYNLFLVGTMSLVPESGFVCGLTIGVSSPMIAVRQDTVRYWQQRRQHPAYSLTSEMLDNIVNEKISRRNKRGTHKDNLSGLVMRKGTADCWF